MIHFFLQVLVLYLKENTGGYWDGSHNKSWGIRGQVNERWTRRFVARYCVKWNGEILEDNTEQRRGRWSGLQRYEKTKRKREKQKQRTGRRESETENIRASRAGFTAGENNDCNDEMCSISPRGWRLNPKKIHRCWLCAGKAGITRKEELSNGSYFTFTGLKKTRMKLINAFSTIWDRNTGRVVQL